MSAVPALAPDCPAIHVAFMPLADEGMFRWVHVGAEEERVPCRHVPISGKGDAVALAYAAAESSRLRIGVAVSRSEIVLHELHMPAGLPVLRFRMDGQDVRRCRLMGSNAARMVVHLPFRFPEDEPEVAVPGWLLGAMDTSKGNGNGHGPEPVRPIQQDKSRRYPDELSPPEIASIAGLITRRLVERGIGV